MLNYELIKEFVIDHNSDEPFYIVDLNEVTTAFERWYRCLPTIKPYYAMKCNPNPVILKLLANLGCNFDCASKTEIAQILNITNDPSRIIFAHPCKYISHLTYAKMNGIDLMTFDSIEELNKIYKYHPDARILLRLAVDDSQSLCKFNIKFGCKSEDIRNMIQHVSNLGLNLVGFSFHVGSGCSSADTYYDALRRCKEAQKIAYEYGYVTKIIDLGGGFVAETGNNNDVTFEDIAIKINQGINDFFENDFIEFIAEPGRFMVQKAYTLVLSVIGKKTIEDGFIYYLNDGVYGSFNCIIFDHQNPELIPLYPRTTQLYKSQIFGNTCDSLDEIKKCVMLPELEIGDYLYVENFAAYTSSAGSDSFNGYKVTSYKYVANV